MRVALLLLIPAVTAAVSQAEWEAFKTEHGKSYPDPAEDRLRRGLYEEAKTFVERHMREYAEGKHTFTVALNRLADLTEAERRQLSGSRVSLGQGHGSESGRVHRVTGRAPAAVDWRDHGMVTEVADQGQCGSSWAFAGAGALEGAWAKAGNDLVNVSVQQVLDCTRDLGMWGCGGGRMSVTFLYVHENGGIETADTYPYTARDQACSPSGQSVVTVSSWVNVPRDDYDALTDAVGTVGPVATAITTGLAFGMYSGGVFRDPNCAGLSAEHGMLIVGYGEDFWLVKNTWGTDWGEDGYIRVYRAANDTSCGLTNTPSYPIV